MFLQHVSSLVIFCKAFWDFYLFSNLKFQFETFCYSVFNSLVQFSCGSFIYCVCCLFTCVFVCCLFTCVLLLFTERSDSSDAGRGAGQSGDRPGAHQERSQRQPGRRGEQIKRTLSLISTTVVSSPSPLLSEPLSLVARRQSSSGGLSVMAMLLLPW